MGVAKFFRLQKGVAAQKRLAITDLDHKIFLLQNVTFKRQTHNKKSK
jgi:hypothetical protein